MRSLVVFVVFPAIALAQTPFSLSGSRTDAAAATFVDANGSVYLTGSTNSPDFPRTQQGPASPPSAPLLASGDGGKTFFRGALPHAVFSLAASPSNLYAGTSAGPYRSADGGYTWQPANAGIANIPANVLATDARFPGRVYAATSQGIFRSEDSGHSWTPGNTGLPVHAVAHALAASPLRPDTFFAIVNQGVFRSRDSALTWAAVKLPTNPLGPAPTTLVIDPSNADVIYVAGAYTNTTQQAFVLKSIDGGATFLQVSTLAVLTSVQAIAVDPANSSTVFAGAIDGSVYRSRDAGLTWSATALPPVTLDALAFDPYHPGNLYALTDQGLYLTSDAGATWSRTTPSVPRRDHRALFFEPALIVLGADPGEHVFVAKWNAAGSLLWSIVLGGSYSDAASSLTVDPAGNVFLAGVTSSTDFPTTPGAFQTNLKGFQNIFLLKLDSSGGRLLSSTLLGGSGSDGFSAMALDASGSVYVTGYAVSNDFPTTPNAFQRAHLTTCPKGAAGDAFVSKFPPSFTSLEYSTLLGGGCAQTAAAIAIDPTGHAYIAGATVSPDFPTTQGSLQPVYGGGYDGFLAELTPRGDGLVFSTFLGGSDAAVAAGVAVDPAGNIYVAGNGDAFPFAPSTINPALQCGGATASYGGLSLAVASAPYLLKIAPGGAGVEALTTFAGCGAIAASLALDAAGQVWVGGIAGGSAYDTVAPLQALAAGNFFLRRFGADAKTTNFSTLLDGLPAFTLDPSGIAYVASTPAMVGKVELAPGPVLIDAVGKYGNLSIPALADLSGPVGLTGGEVVTLTGRNFGGSLGGGSLEGESLEGGSLQGESLEGVAVQFDGVPAPLLSVQAGRIVCVTPFAVVERKRSTVRVLARGSASNSVVVTALPSSAEILAVVNQDGTLNSADHPAPGGSPMTAYVSGLGVPVGGGADGVPGLVMPQTFAVPVALAFYNNAAIQYIGQAPGQVSGITQINFTAPLLDGQNILSVSAGNTTDFVFAYLSTAADAPFAAAATSRK